MKVVDVVQRVLLLLLLVPVVVILVDATVTYFHGDEDHAVVVFFADAADLFTPDVLTTMFEDQTFLQTAALAVLFYGLVAAVIGLAFRGLRGLIRTVVDVRGRPR